MLKNLTRIGLILFSSFAFAESNSILFFQTANQADLIKEKGDRYTLRIVKPLEHINYFSNRPKKQAGFLPLHTFLTFWKDKKIPYNFAKIPPNVAITSMLRNGKQQNYVASITNATYKNKSLQYTLDIIVKKPIHTGQMKHISLFFDDINWDPGGFGE